MEEKFYRRFRSFCNSLDALNEAKTRDFSDSFVLSGTSENTVSLLIYHGR